MHNNTCNKNDMKWVIVNVGIVQDYTTCVQAPVSVMSVLQAQTLTLVFWIFVLYQG